MNKAGFMKDALILFVITLVSGCLLGGVYQVTKEPIEKATIAANNKAYKAVFNEAESFEPDDALTGPVLPALRQDRGFFISGIFKRRRHTLLILFRNQGYSVFTEECIFSSSVKESFSSLSIYGKLGIQIFHKITIHG